MSNPKEYQLAWSPVAGVLAGQESLPPAGPWRGLWVLPGTKLSPQFPSVADESLDPAGQRRRGYPSKITFDGAQLQSLLRPEGSGFLLAAIQRGGTTTTLEGGLAYEHHLAPSLTDQSFGSFGLRQYLRVGLPKEVLWPVYCRQMTFEFRPGALVSSTASMLCEEFSRFGAAEVVTGAWATAPPPRVRGLTDYAERIALDADVYLRVADVTGAPASVQMEAKVGTGGAYGPAFDVLEGAWTPVVLDAAGSLLGPEGAAVEVYFEDLSEAALADELRLPRDIPDPLVQPIASPDPPFNEIGVQVRLDGERFVVQDATLSITERWQQSPQLGGRFPRGSVRSAGERQVDLSFNRNATDRRIVDAAETGQPLAVEIECRSSVPVGGAGSGAATRYQCRFVLANLEATTELMSPQSADAYQEPVSFIAHPSDGGGDDLEIYLTNGTGDLAA